MSQPDESWHGWSHENSALFVSPTSDGQHVALFVQQDRDVRLAAVFTSEQAAAEVMAWLDTTIDATAQANAALVRRLRSEQPLSAAYPGQEDDQ